MFHNCKYFHCQTLVLSSRYFHQLCVSPISLEECVHFVYWSAGDVKTNEAAGAVELKASALSFFSCAVWEGFCPLKALFASLENLVWVFFFKKRAILMSLVNFKECPGAAQTREANFLKHNKCRVIRFQSSVRDLPFLCLHFFLTTPLCGASSRPQPDPYCKIVVRITLEVWGHLKGLFMRICLSFGTVRVSIKYLQTHASALLFC